MTNRQNKFLIGTFLLLIFGCTAGSILMPKRDFSEKENRTLQQLPKPELSGILDGSFSSKYEKYLSDQFFGRDGWIAMKTAVDRSMGKQEANGVYFAKDGYLIESHKEDFQGKTAKTNLQTVAAFLENWKEQYSPDHMQVCLVPNAVDIYQDKLPAYAVNTVEQDYLNLARGILPGEYFLDVEELLMTHNAEQLYYRTDHHWTTYASRLVYEEWASEINLPILPVSSYEVTELTNDFYGTIDAKVSTTVTPDTIEAYLPVNPVYYTLLYNQTETRESLYDESFLQGRDKYAVFFGGNQPLIQAGTDADNDRKLLVLKDSYANCFLSFALQDFSAIDIVDLRYFNENLNDYMLNNHYTDILLLYNVSGFAQDTGISKLALASGQED